MKNCDEMAKDVLDRYHEYTESKSKKKGIAPKLAIGVACAALVSLAAVGAVRIGKDDAPAVTPEVIQTETDRETKEVVTETRESVETPKEKIVWLGTSDGTDEAEVFKAPEELSRSVLIEYRLIDKVRQSEDGTLFAVGVRVRDAGWMFTDGGGTEGDAELERLAAEKDAAFDKLIDVTAECENRIASERDISLTEAAARKYSDPEYLAAREDYRAATDAFNAEEVKKEYEKYGSVIEELTSRGISVICNAESADYQAYLCAMNEIAIIAASKEQILALSDFTPDCTVELSAANENASKYGEIVNYDFGEVHLTGDSKLTDELTEAYREANGTALDVEVAIGYFGETYDDRESLDRACCEKLGMTMEEIDASDDPEVIDRFLEIRRSIIYHKDYNEEVRNALLRDGELIEIRDYTCSFTARLTEGRALELVSDRRIAYIRLIGETEDMVKSYDQFVIAE